MAQARGGQKAQSAACASQGMNVETEAARVGPKQRESEAEGTEHGMAKRRNVNRTCKAGAMGRVSTEGSMNCRV